MIATELSIRDFRTNLRVLEREVELSMTSEAGCCGVTFAQCHLLLEVERRGQTSVTELAGALELDKSTLSRTVDAACRAGLIDRTMDPCEQAAAGPEPDGGGKEDRGHHQQPVRHVVHAVVRFHPASKRAMVVESVAHPRGGDAAEETQPGRGVLRRRKGGRKE